MPGYDGVYTNKAGKVAEGCATFWRRSRYRVAARADLNMRQLFAAAASSDAAGPATHAPSAVPVTSSGHNSSAVLEHAVDGSTGDASDTARADSDPAGQKGSAKRHARFAPLLRALPHLETTLQQVGTVGQVLILVPTTVNVAAALRADADSAPAAAALRADDGSSGIATAEQQRAQQSAGVMHIGQIAGDHGDPCSQAAAGRTADADAGASEEEALCVVNTHLFYHPWAPHIRILHVAAMMDEAAALAQSTQRALELQSRPALLFCGDLNSDHSWGMPGLLGADFRIGNCPSVRQQIAIAMRS